MTARPNGKVSSWGSTCIVSNEGKAREDEGEPRYGTLGSTADSMEAAVFTLFSKLFKNWESPKRFLWNVYEGVVELDEKRRHV